MTYVSFTIRSVCRCSLNGYFENYVVARLASDYAIIMILIAVPFFVPKKFDTEK